MMYKISETLPIYFESSSEGLQALPFLFEMLVPLQLDVEGLLSEVEAFFLVEDRFFLLEGVAAVEVYLTFDKATVLEIQIKHIHSNFNLT